MEDMLRVGVVSSTHGLKGEVKVFPTTDDVKRFDYLKDVVLVSNKEILKLEVSNVRYFKNMVIVKFKGIDDINDIEKYKGSELFVTRENAIPLEEGEYYIADLLDCKVYDEKEAFIGLLSEVLTSSANVSSISPAIEYRTPPPQIRSGFFDEVIAFTASSISSPQGCCLLILNTRF